MQTVTIYAKHEAAAPAVSRAVGQLGDRLELTLEVTHRIALADNGYGPQWLFVLRGEGGERLSWKTGTLPGIRVGDTFRAKATVKAYAEFRGVIETRLARLTKVKA